MTDPGWVPLTQSVEAPRPQRNELVGAINPPCKASRESLIWNLAAIRNVEIVKLMFPGLQEEMKGSSRDFMR